MSTPTAALPRNADQHPDSPGRHDLPADSAGFAVWRLGARLAADPEESQP